MIQYWLWCILAITGFCCLAEISLINCPTQPADLLKGYDAMGLDPECIIDFNIDTIFPSSILVEEALAVPQSQAWGRCLNCIWNNHFGIFNGGSDEFSGYQINENIAYKKKNHMEFVAYSPTLKSTSIYHKQENNSVFERGFDLSLPHEEFVSDIVGKFCHCVIV